MNKPFQAIRNNRIFKVYVKANGFCFEILKYSGISTLGMPKIGDKIILIENDSDRIMDFVDGLTQPDLLHPVYKNYQISPFGNENKYWVNIKWEGWDIEKIQEKILFSSEKYPDLIELATMISGVKDRIKQLDEKAKKLLRKSTVSSTQIEQLYRTTAHLLVDLYSELLPVNPWFLRGFLPLPFRRVTIFRFKNNKSLSIRLSPQETRKLVRFIKFQYFK